MNELFGIARVDFGVDKFAGPVSSLFYQCIESLVKVLFERFVGLLYPGGVLARSRIDKDGRRLGVFCVFSESNWEARPTPKIVKSHIFVEEVLGDLDGG
jgi:hypothetical protein